MDVPLKQASWIGGGGIRSLRQEFAVPFTELSEVRLFITAQGYCVAEINGRPVTKDVLYPAVSRYDKRAYYCEYDVSDLIKAGTNAIGITLGGGFYGHRYETDRRAALCALEICSKDGEQLLITSDTGWQMTSEGPVEWDNYLKGEHYNALKEMSGWSEAGFVAGPEWTPAALSPCLDAERNVLERGVPLTRQDVPIRIIQELDAAAMSEPEPGVFVFDFGRIVSGWPELTVAGGRGDKVCLRMGELADERGFVVGVIEHDSHVEYTLKGEGVEKYEPSFFYTGLRYVEVHGFPGVPDLSSVRVKVVHNDIARHGDFACSSELLTAIHNAYVDTQLYNLHSIPTDCPGREKQGWLGDALVTTEAACFNLDMLAFYRKWFTDMTDDQHEDGAHNHVVPRPPHAKYGRMDVPWMSASVIMPWLVYMMTGDLQVLKDSYERMRKFARWLISCEDEDGLMPLIRFGDWLSLEPTDMQLLSTIYYYEVCNRMTQIAEILQLDGDAVHFGECAARVRSAFQKKYLPEDLHSLPADCRTQAALASALKYNLVRYEQKTQVIGALVADIEAHDWSITTGVLGSYAILEVLSENGHFDTALKLAQREDYPGWGHFIREGGGTIWENWNGKSSHCHPMFGGGIDAWFYRYIAGIREMEPGFAKVRLNPCPGNLEWAKGRCTTPAGVLQSDWSVDNGRFSWTVDIPEGVSARLTIPATSVESVVMNGRSLLDVEEVMFEEFLTTPSFDGHARVVLNAKPGRYAITSVLRRMD